ncbi:MAG: c-type cytochrome [Planctomycetaceae bacterium]|jgi:putative membrane-bound dehydrogenase-like protein|nr:c-type cytochrome [Planctomycetaceae bacterium]MBT6485360.1 c-type cytochrome [Planctomycetaceae bacterium]MBT6495442.1 c-type cytochrome [Planctomycetaceae bacterium]
MRFSVSSYWPVVVVTAALLSLHPSALFAQDKSATGPATEKRFPKLQLPAGFQATLFACDPLIEYPSVIAIGPKPGSMFVAQDYMSGLGYNSPRRSEIKLVEDTDGDGYADRSTLFAGDFNSIQGVTWHDGSVYVMHSPLLTSLRDEDGDGKADTRRDLLSGLGLSPKENPNLLHCANGVVAGHDGWLYLALGDRGCSVQRPEGDRLILIGGGILRCRLDGRDLHIFATGLRNIYDVALDEGLNVFVRDNENDGGDYMIRVCHSFFGADHGYPYHYYERPTEALPPLADLGRGSSAGGVCYLETAFPAEYRGSLFFCEWGRAVVRYDRKRSGSTFAKMSEHDFSAAAPSDPYGLKPTDVIVDRDGSLLVSDWADGQRPKRGRGRVYRITFGAAKPRVSSETEKDRGETASLDHWLARLDSPGYFARTEAQRQLEHRDAVGLDAVRRAMKDGKLGPLARRHAVWIIATNRGPKALGELFQFAEFDLDLSVRCQAVRALADLTDPVLSQHKLDAGRGDIGVAERLAKLAVGAHPQFLREVVVTLGRLRWREAPRWVAGRLKRPDAALAHAAMQTMRRADNWPQVLLLLDRPTNDAARKAALIAIAERAELNVVDALLLRLKSEAKPERRREYADLLTRVHKRLGKRPYWGYRPPPRPANTVSWDRTAQIEIALDGVLADGRIRVGILGRMQREQISVRLASLNNWLRTERQPLGVTAILDSLKDRSAADIRPLIRRVILDRDYDTDNRLAALELFSRGLDEKTEGELLAVAKEIEDDSVAAAVFRELGKRPKLPSSELLLARLSSIEEHVRAAALESLTKMEVKRVAPRVSALLNDADANVRRVAAHAAGQFQIEAAIAPLKNRVRDSDPLVRRECLNSLRLLKVTGVEGDAVAALQLPLTQPAALAYLREFGSPLQLNEVTAVAKQNRSTEILRGALQTLAAWNNKSAKNPEVQKKVNIAIAAIQGQTGTLLNWTRLSDGATGEPIPISSGAVTLDAKPAAGSIALAFAEVFFDQPRQLQFLGAVNGTLSVSLDGKPIYEQSKQQKFATDSQRFETHIDAGLHRITVAIGAASGSARFQLRFREKSSSVARERLMQLALKGTGSVRRGQEVFVNVEKSLCMKCHRLGEKGGKIGPDLTGVGSRFSRVHLIESILEPSRAIAPSYGTYVVVTTGGQVHTGVKTSETADVMTLGTTEGKTIEIVRREIEAIRRQEKSTMPEDVEKRLSEREFLDLIAFLLSQKKSANK